MARSGSSYILKRHSQMTIWKLPDLVLFTVKRCYPIEKFVESGRRYPVGAYFPYDLFRRQHLPHLRERGLPCFGVEIARGKCVGLGPRNFQHQPTSSTTQPDFTRCRGHFQFLVSRQSGLPQDLPAKSGAERIPDPT